MMTKLSISDCRCLASRAWAIRRFHAARLGVPIRSVSWRECLLLARDEWFRAEEDRKRASSRSGWFPLVRVNLNPVCLEVRSAHSAHSSCSWRTIGCSLVLFLVGGVSIC